ncbi:hypothetical protein GCM10009759_38050 [Kitasatospora saccharophila]|uniref:Uncharacterized protein n=1 Tax=Kitasatospora saccharophila TaxID=407973 RepID=A0ABP5IM24_9ACTN
MNALLQLWERGERPADDGLYRADGRAWYVTEDYGPDDLAGFALAEPTSVRELLDPERTTSADTHPAGHLVLPDGSGTLVCGDGSLGSEGFVARLGPDGAPVWLLTLADGNPFEAIALTGTRARFTNNRGHGLVVDLAEPPYGP